MPEDYEYDDESEADRPLHAELPRSAPQLKEMLLTLGKATLTVPAAGAGAFRSLTAILLSHVILLDSDADLRLGRLLSSSCCPALRTAQLSYIEGVTELRVDAAGALEELRLVQMRRLRAVDVAAPGLRVLGVKCCFWLNSVRVSAPRLQVLACQQTGCAERLSFDGAASLRRVEGLQLPSHWTRSLGEKEKDADRDSAAVWFLRNGTAVCHLSLELMWPETMYGEAAYYEDNTTRVPMLPNVTSLHIKFGYGWWKGHTLGATVAKLIAKCTEVEELSIQTPQMVENCFDQNCICNCPNGWEHQKLSLERLRNVEFRDFLPVDTGTREDDLGSTGNGISRRWCGGTFSNTLLWRNLGTMPMAKRF